MTVQSSLLLMAIMWFALSGAAVAWCWAAARRDPQGRETGSATEVSATGASSSEAQKRTLPPGLKGG